MSDSILRQVGRGTLKGLLFVAVLLGGIVAMNWNKNRKDEAVSTALAPLSLGADEYYKLASRKNLSSSSKRRPASKPVFLCMSSNSNTLPVGHRSSGKIDPLTLQLPEALQPRSPAEVHTVIALHWSQELIAKYSNGDEAYREKCLVEVFDKTTGNLLLRQQFLGGDPPSKVSTPRHKNHVAKHFGDRCDRQILELVTHLFGDLASAKSPSRNAQAGSEMGVGRRFTASQTKHIGR